MSRLRIDLGDRSYDILVGTGILDSAGEEISRVCTGKSAAIVTNPRIGNLYAERLVSSLRAAGISSQVITVPAGERYKTLRTMERIYEKLLDQKLDRGGIVIGLGGGVIGDMAGFAAATYLRGVDFVQIPTSLLAQVDASVGGKTGVDLSRGKNLVGAFHQPRLVLIDISTLASLPRREFRSGLAEVIKHGIIRDREYFAYIEKNLDSIIRLDQSALEYTIERSCEIKADVVRRDERESGLRRILNYGHTVGHAVESLTGYRDYKHGEAVAIGMVTAALVAEKRETAEPGLADRITALIRAARLPYKYPQNLDTKDIIAAMGLDKKVSHGRLNAVLVDKLGSAYVTDDVSAETWKSALRNQGSLP